MRSPAVHPLPLTPPERRAFDNLVAPARQQNSEIDEFEAWLAEEIFTLAHIPTSHKLLGFAGLMTGALSALVTYYLAFRLMKIFGTDDLLAALMGGAVILPRIALGSNALEDATLKILHDYYQKNKLPHKNNQALLRKSADGFVYISSFALGVMGIYILQNNLPYSALARNILTPSILLGNGIVNVQPFLDANQTLFAKYSPGLTAEIREKRAALIEALNVALNEIKAYDADQFETFYQGMISHSCTPPEARSRWAELLALADSPTQPAPPAKTAFTRARGHFGWFLSLLSSLTNIQISIAEAVWLAEVFHTQDENFVPTVGALSSVLCIVAYGVLCAGPTQEVFEYQTEKQGWEPTHPSLRRLTLAISLVLGSLSAVPNASWPIILGVTWYEQALAGPAFVSPGALYFNAMKIRLNRWIDAWDRHWGQSRAIDHMDALTKLKSLPAAVAQLPDAHIDKLVPTDAPLLRHYRLTQASVEGSDPPAARNHLTTYLRSL